MADRYEKTDDPNIIKKITTTDSFIQLDKLERQISDLQKEIDSIPELKTEPDQESLEFYNDFVGMGSNKYVLIEQMEAKINLLNILKSLKAKE